MKSKTFYISILNILVLGLVGAGSVGAATIFPRASQWRYFKGISEASTPDTTAWRANGFNDSVPGWLTGNGPFFSENATGFTGNTDLTADMGNAVGQGDVTCIFMRRTFSIADPSQIAQLRLDMDSDDGCIVWINGVEVASLGRPANPITFQSLAPNADGEPKTDMPVVNNPGAFLVAGINTIAVQAFNQAAASSDFLIDVALSSVGFDSIPPVVALINPSPGTVGELTQITVTFNEEVSGVDGPDLTLNGASATSVIGSVDTYTFFFPQPVFGPVHVDWAAGHGIKDVGVPGNPLNPATTGNTWDYMLTDSFPPQVTAIIPPAGSTVVALTSIEVQFDENVTGVNASDLIVAGAGATGLNMLSPSRYAFTFAQPTPGQISVSWSGTHGIKDTAAVPNDFAGGSWSYNLDPNATAAILHITEFIASNRSILADEEGDFEDWIEIHNSGQIAADLDRWCLTDDPGDLNKWRFPKTNLVAGGYMIIFASEKDRRVPGAPLHTNFKLGTGGDYLALVKPDGVTVVSVYAPEYPDQIENVSYGLSVIAETQTLLGDTAPVKVRVPTDPSLGTDWTLGSFSDASWTSGINGVGFEGSPGTSPNLSAEIATDIGGAMRNINSTAYVRLPFNVPDASLFNYLTLRVKYDDGFIAYLNGTEVARRGLVARLGNSATEFSGIQGQNNWRHGYYNKTLDANGTYNAADFIPFNGGEGQGAWNGTSQQWNNTLWDLNTAAAAPWTELGVTDSHPNGNNSGNEHWAIRRWVSEVNSDLLVHFHLRKVNTGGGNGVTGRIFHNGIEVFNRTIAFNDSSMTTNDVHIAGVSTGDFIDFALDARGTDNQNGDGSDGSAFTADIELANGVAPAWNLAASVAHPDSAALLYEDIDISQFLGGLQSGQNLLAIQGLNIGASDDDFLIKAQVQGRKSGVVSDVQRYFTTPTPGAENGVGVDVLGPIVSDLEHYPNVALPGQPLRVTVSATQSFFPVSSVTLRYLANYGSISSLNMVDNGTGGDKVAGDHIYTANIPGGIAAAGEMIRWYVSASDNQGRLMRYPPFADPLNSPEYDGTMVYLEQTNNLPVLHLYASNPTAINNAATTRCSIFYDGLFYDNLNINIHGQSSSGFPKHSYDIDFHRGYNFRWKRGELEVDDINLLTTYPDKAYMRNMLSYGTYQFADSPYHFVEPVRVQLNGAFYGLWHMVENGDDNWLERIGRNPNNSLYKMYNTFSDTTDYTISSAEAEKKTRKQEGNADLIALYNGLGVPFTGALADVQTNYIFDNINIAGSVNHLAARVVTSDRDCCHKNYYFYRDTEGSGEWEGFPWDVDLSFGRNWKNSPVTYWDNTSYTNNTLFVGGNNGFFNQLFVYPPTRQMYLRRVRTLMDTLQQSPTTLGHQLIYESWIDAFAEKLRPDAALDLAKWGTWFDTGNNTPTVADPAHSGSAGPTMDPNNPDYETLDEAVFRLKDYMIGRRGYMFSKLISAEIPDPQPPDATLTFGAIEANPSSAIQAQEYIELVNPNTIALDITGWRLEGAIQHVFPGGTVVPAGFSLYVTPDVKAFRARSASPRANQGRFAQGNYKGQLSARGESLYLVNAAGVTNRTINYPGNPSLAQQFLRITEIMYHPAQPPTGSPFIAEDYEYVELKNISTTQSIPLAGIHFTNGIQYAFDGSLPSLAPGQTIVLVQNSAAFTSRYGAGALIAGQYLGLLDNAGDRVRLDDAVGEKILDFEYNNTWYPSTDGLGFSLVIVDETAPYYTWDLKESWRASGRYNGSAGGSDPAPFVVAPIQINEALTHTDLPLVDYVEVHNTNSFEVNIGGWFLSDDFLNPRKYRIPDNTIVGINGYAIILETAFNPTPGTPPSFALSSTGDEIYIFSGNGTDLTGYFDGESFGAAENPVSFGRYVTSIGKEHFVAQSARTPNGVNAGPKIGPVVISEIMYHPPDLAGGLDNGDDEYIELHNITGASVNLYDPNFPNNGWQLADGVEYEFPGGTSLGAGQYLLVVGFDTDDTAKLADFRLRFNVPVGTQVLGPFNGQLDNSADDVELFKPDNPNIGGDVPYILVDKVDYEDVTPWSEVADGYGPALSRVNDNAYGNDVINWVAVAPSPGRAVAGGTPPAIVTQPANVAGVLGATAAMTVTASGSEPRSYQWRYNSNTIAGATSPTLTFNSLKFSNKGSYDVIIFNGAGSIVSVAAQLDVLVPAIILTQPVSQSLLFGSTATFSVVAASSSTITYQWKKNNVPIPGKTGTSLTLLDIVANDSGVYTVDITDAVGTITSAPAVLNVLYPPIITMIGRRYEVPVGGSVTLSVESTGSFPMGYRWRKGNSTLDNQVISSHVSFYKIPVVQATDAGTYTVVLTNAASFTPGVLSPSITIVIVTDTDGDGMPDAWENANGLNAGVNDAAGDKDSDQVSNRDEYIAGTDPSNPNSYLKVEDISLNGGVLLDFFAPSNKTYTIQYKEVLQDTSWSWLQDIVGSPTPGMRHVADPLGTENRYYRLVTPRQ